MKDLSNVLEDCMKVCEFLSVSLARARASTDHIFFCIRTLMKLTTPVDSEFASLALQ